MFLNSVNVLYFFLMTTGRYTTAYVIDIISGRFKITGYEKSHDDWRKEEQLQTPDPSMQHVSIVDNTLHKSDYKRGGLIFGGDSRRVWQIG